MSESHSGGIILDKIAKRSGWVERQLPTVKEILRMDKGITDEDYRPSLKKLVHDAVFERYSEPFKSPNIPNSSFDGDVRD